MLSGLYLPGHSPVHRARALHKILALLALGSGLFLLPGPGWALGAGLAVLGLYRLAGVGAATAAAQLRPAAWVLAVLFVVQLVGPGPVPALTSVLRFSVLILAAALVTLTTPTPALIDGLEQGLRRLGPRVPARRIGLAVALCLRFIPAIQTGVGEAREAQQARGGRARAPGLAVPSIIRTLKLADAVAEAVYARGFEAGGGTRRDAGRGRGRP